MKLFGTLAQRVWLGVFVTAGLALAPPSAKAACDTPDARINMGSAQVPDFKLVNGNWVANTIQINGQPSSPKQNKGGLYQWTFVGTPLGTLAPTTDPQPNFTPPDVTTSTQVTLRLTVTVAGCPGSDSEDITLTITNAHDVVINTAPHSVPTASPGSATEGTVVTLDGSASWDVETAQANLIYTWTQTVGPAVTLLPTPNPAIKTFVAPNFTGNTLLTFRLTVSDGALDNSNTTDVNISWTNDGPVASLVCPDLVFDVNEGQSFTFNGSASSDADDGIFKYEWKQLEGLPEVPGVGDWNTPIVTFVVPHLSLQESGLIPFKLTVTDHNNAKSSATCSIFIHDVTGPIISVPSDFIAEADSATGAIIGPDRGYVVSSWDAVDGPLPLVNASAFFMCEPPPGAAFALDQVTPVACIAHDSAGNGANADFSISVRDRTAPVIDVPFSFAVEATGPDGAPANYVAKSHDVVDGEKDANCLPLSGSVFPINAPGPTTTVSCNATDAHGNVAQAKTFTVAVHDTTAPTIDAHPDVKAEATGPSGAVVTYTSPATHDVVDGGGTATCAPASGSTFALGTTLVTCSAADAAGNDAVGTHFNVVVVDSTPPTIDARDDIVDIEATGPDGAAVIYNNPATHDLVDGNGVASCLPASGSVFGLGTTLVTCSATDAADNPAVDTHFNVTVVDSTPPTIDPHGNVGPIEATSSLGAQVFYTSPATHDAVSGDDTASCTPTSGSIFALGETTVTCSASDAAGNAATPTQFVVTVRDSTPPTIDPHADILGVEATGPDGAAVPYVSPATHDLVDGAGTASCAPASGSTFALGSTFVTCSASDAAGNAAQGTQFHVTVVDTTAPVVIAPANVTAEATGPLTAVPHGAATASDAVGVVSLTNDAPATFPLGTTTITWTAADAAGNSASATSTVTVVDTTAPVVTPPANVTAEASGPLTAVAHGTATATDAVGVVSLTNDAPATFPLGTTTITWTAADAAGNSASATSIVTVVDTTAPAVTVPASLVREATSAAGASVTFSATAIDLVYGNVAVTCAPASGSTFALGVTTVACAATDGSGNTGHAAFTVTVQDTTAPVIHYLGDVTATAGSNSNATVNYTQPTAWDIVDGTVPVNCTPASGTTFPVGTNTVYCSATDQHNNTASGSFKVTVSYAWTGFFRPVDMAPIVNSSKAGSAIPIKFSLGGNQGMGIMAAGYPKSAPMSCGGAVEDPLLETVTAGASSLQYDSGAAQYIYVWKSEKSWAGTCRQIQVKLADGTLHTANFSFK
ncbi:HYR domain-containing protein [Lysobacter sp. P5_B9]